MGAGKGHNKRVQTSSSSGTIPQSLDKRLEKKTFYANDGKKFVAFGAGLIDKNTIEQMRQGMSLEIIRKGSLQADAHVGYGAAIGSVLATSNAVIPYGVGADQACGMRATKLDVKFADIKDDLKSYLHAMHRKIPIGLGKTHNKPIDHEIFDRDEWNEEPFKSLKNKQGVPIKEVARRSLSSVGAGNHFYSICEGEDGYAYTLIHFGSRAPGYKSAEYFMDLAKKEHPTQTGLSWLTMDSYAGQAYWQAHFFMKDFAYAGRDLVGKNMATILGVDELSVVHNHHNFLDTEEHDGETLYVHRKGATPANLEEPGIIPGSMGDPSYIVTGLGNEESLRSSSHGAGRIMSRTAAHGKWDKKKKDWKTRPRVTEGAMKAWLKKEGVILIGGDLDESPHVYKRIDEVMTAQTELVKPIMKLSPRGVVMSPPDPRKRKMRMRSKPIDDS